MVALQQTGLLELGQYAIDGGKADVHAVCQQMAVYVFGRDVARRTLCLQFVEEVQDF